MIKTAHTDVDKMCLRREYRNYRIEEIASSPHIRSLRDTVWSDQDGDNPSSLVFEWMDQTLTSVSMPQFRANSLLPKTVSKAVLSALSVLKALNAIHTGNIYLHNCTF
jgi:hypothetical protein